MARKKRVKNKYDISLSTQFVSAQRGWVPRFKRDTYRVTYSGKNQEEALKKARDYFGIRKGQHSYTREVRPWNVSPGGPFNFFAPLKAKYHMKIKIKKRKR